MKRILHLFTITILTIGITACGIDNISTENSLNDKTDKQVTEYYAQTTAVTLDSMKIPNINKILYDSFEKGVNGTIYPDDFCGTYIGLDDRKLHLKVKGDDNNYKEKGKAYIESIKNKTDMNNIEDYIVIEKGNVSLNQLNEILTELNDNIERFSISLAAINEEKNIVEVGILDITKKDDLLEFLKSKFGNSIKEYIQIVEYDVILL